MEKGEDELRISIAKEVTVTFRLVEDEPGKGGKFHRVQFAIPPLRIYPDKENEVGLGFKWEDGEGEENVVAAVPVIKRVKLDHEEQQIDVPVSVSDGPVTSSGDDAQVDSHVEVEVEVDAKDDAKDDSGSTVEATKTIEAREIQDGVQVQEAAEAEGLKVEMETEHEKCKVAND